MPEAGRFAGQASGGVNLIGRGSTHRAVAARALATLFASPAGRDGRARRRPVSRAHVLPSTLARIRLIGESRGRARAGSGSVRRGRCPVVVNLIGRGSTHRAVAARALATLFASPAGRDGRARCRPVSRAHVLPSTLARIRLIRESRGRAHAGSGSVGRGRCPVVVNLIGRGSSTGCWRPCPSCSERRGPVVHRPYSGVLRIVVVVVVVSRRPLIETTPDTQLGATQRQ
jgi:hypothetical protein